jgi:hypothetical protein
MTTSSSANALLHSTSLNYQNRASTIFPLFVSPGVSAKLVFLAYWPLKHETSVHLVLTLRDAEGRTLATVTYFIDTILAVELSLTDIFASQLVVSNGFTHTVEVEVFSDAPPRFTYPAVTLVYAGPFSVSAVHSCSRAYNPGEQVADYALQLPQAGFDVYLTDNSSGYIAFCGGLQRRYNLTITAEVEREMQGSVCIELDNEFRKLHVIRLNDVFPTLRHAERVNAPVDSIVSLQLFSITGFPLSEKRRIPASILNNGYQMIGFSEYLHEASVPSGQYAFAKITFDSATGGSTPVRQKFALNVSCPGHESQGTNICFAPNVISERIVTKPFTRRWGPIGGASEFVFVYSNTSLQKATGSKSATEVPSGVVIKIFNSLGDVLEQTLSLPFDASIVLNPQKDASIAVHLRGGPGQVLIQADNFSSDAFFFSRAGRSVGGDHAF